MTTLLDEPATRARTGQSEAAQPRSTSSASSATERLRSTAAAVRLSVRWFGVRKTLTPDQKSQAAGAFGAEGEFLSAGKKLLDTRHPAYKAVSGVRNRAVSYWKSLTLPFPEPGVRLIRQDKIEGFDEQMRSFHTELDESVWRRTSTSRN